MLSISRALLLNPKLLMLDDSSQGLAAHCRGVFEDHHARPDAKGLQSCLLNRTCGLRLKSQTAPMFLTTERWPTKATLPNLVGIEHRVRKLAGASAEKWDMADRAGNNRSSRTFAGDPSFGTPHMRRYRIAVIPGDEIGKEVIPAGVEVLTALASRDGGFKITFEHFDWGSEYYHSTGLMMPADGREHMKDHDAIYFGAVKSPKCPITSALWGLRLAICQPFDQYANVRPARLLPGIVSPLRHVTGPEID